MIEEIKHEGKILGIILKNNYKKEGVNFLTPDEFSQQLAFMSHKKGKIIDPHVHNKVQREVHYTQEVLVIKKGKLQVDFYNDEQVYLESRELTEGDVILLSSGGHGFEVLEDIEMVEIKQGPYAGENDKIRFKKVER